MVVALLIHCSKSTSVLGETGESSSSSVAVGKELPFAVVDCLLIVGRYLWEPLRGKAVK